MTFPFYPVQRVQPSSFTPYLFTFVRIITKLWTSWSLEWSFGFLSSSSEVIIPKNSFQNITCTKNTSIYKIRSRSMNKNVLLYLIRKIEMIEISQCIIISKFFFSVYISLNTFDEKIIKFQTDRIIFHTNDETCPLFFCIHYSGSTYL